MADLLTNALGTNQSDDDSSFAEYLKKIDDRYNSYLLNEL